MNNNKQQTAVDWLEEQIIRFHNWKLNPIYDENCFDAIELDKSIKQAKEMEKEQHKQTWFDSTAQFDNAAAMTYKKDFEHYYNETFNTNNP